MIASVIVGLPDYIRNEVRYRIALAFAVNLKADNLRFDQKKFMIACGFDYPS